MFSNVLTLRCTLGRILPGLLFCMMLFWAQSAHAANRYWVGTTNRWETTANWAATSGGAGGQTVPGSSDIAIFDGGGSSDVLLRSAVSVQGLLLASTTTKTVTVGTGSFVIGSSNLRVGAGTLRGAARPLRVTGSVTQTGGYILEMSSTLSLSGSLSIGANATFGATGSLIFSGNANQTFSVEQNATLLAGHLVLRNTGSAGSNKIIVDCENVSENACGIGLFAPATSVTVTTGQLDLETYSNSFMLLDGGVTIANNALASVNVGNGSLVMSGSLVVGSAGNISFGGGGGLTFSGTGTMTVAMNANATIGGFSVLQQDSVPQLNGCPTLTLASNISVNSVVLFGNPCTVNLSTYTLAATGAIFINVGTMNLQSGKVVNAASAFAVKDPTYTTTQTSVGIGNQLYLTITDGARNLVAFNITESLNVVVTTSGGDSETVTLTEVYAQGALGFSPIYGVFRGSVGTAEAQSVTQNDGVIQLVGNSATVTVTYTDPVDGLTNSTIVTLSRSTSTSSSGSSGGGGGGGGGSRRTLPGTSSSSSSSSQSSVSSASSTSSASSSSFRDVPASSWFASFVQQLMDLGIVSGYKDAQGNPLHEFRPANSVTYAELAKMATEAAGISPLSGSSMNTSDDGQWSEGYIALMESKGITVFQNHTLDVNAPAPRGAVVQMLLETFGVTLSATENPYSDVPSSSPFASAILQATHNGIVSGDDGKTTFRPDDSINRAEVSKMVLKAMEAYGE